MSLPLSLSRAWLLPLVRLVAAALAVVALVAGSRWILRATAPDDRGQLQALNDSLRLELAAKTARLDSMAQAAAASAQPHQEAQRAAEAGEREVRRAIAAARAAVRRDSLAMVAALEELARRAEEQLWLHGIERQRATERIQRLEVAVTYAPVVLQHARGLVEVQDLQLAAERAQRRWWRTVVRAVCYAGPVAGGAAAGTLAGGPLGAATGGTIGLGVGAIACR